MIIEYDTVNFVVKYYLMNEFVAVWSKVIRDDQLNDKCLRIRQLGREKNEIIYSSILFDNNFSRIM